MEGNIENSSGVSHRKIQRLIKTQQPPAIRCSVCGYACRSAQSFKKCADEQCRKFSPISCMFPNEQSFDCSITANFREKAGVSEVVEYIDSVSEENPERTDDKESNSKKT